MTKDKKGVARIGSHLGSRTTTVKARILLFLDEHPRWFLVKKLAKEIDANIDYVRRCCREMAKAGLIHVRNLYIAKEYSTKCFFPATLYRVKQSPDVPLPMVHGLSLKTRYEVARISNHGIGIGTDFQFNKYYPYKWQPGRVIRYKFGSNGTLDVRLQATLNPLSFEDFKHFLSFLDGFFKIPVWSNMDGWIITQYGLNKDILTLQTNEQITLAALGNFFSQVYDKTIMDLNNPGQFLPVQRYEYHISEPIVAKEFMTLFQGGVSSYIQQQLAFATNQLIRELNVSNKGLIRALENLFYELRKRDDDGPAAPIKRRSKK